MSVMRLGKFDWIIIVFGLIGAILLATYCGVISAVTLLLLMGVAVGINQLPRNRYQA
ncbi:hypothetical protein IV56_GL001224 [Lacticaseibacillus saniviri JCM 17471 = DSM 24301]|uniref:Uncharacterized protein n=2 Tax=Lacticaseibacillus saniviri TaxID=931533 RepID=A0A0R2N0E3_9LACO|nr:hypothetical protein IV56_GL001224 [Lacticaseibacillus saniviri JCM 17471 = DSM 24301]